ncbi:hypothetical protein N7563_22080 [Leclercia adecarboxylata ATCC 23216 = NBRC 102595]|nr:hypothetical protein [Leclercia adecarboxylata ATCC 23216 = NBRC 102595]
MAQYEPSKQEEKSSRRKAAQVMWESSPDMTAQAVADALSLSVNTVNKWSSDYKWKRHTPDTATTAKARTSLAIVKRAMQVKQAVISTEEANHLAAVQYLEQRDKVASKIDQDVRQLDHAMQAIAIEAFNTPTSDAQKLDGLLQKARVLAGIATAKARNAKTLATIWRLESGPAARIDNTLTRK